MDIDAVQRGYARWLRYGTWAGVVALAGGFAAYLLGMAPHVPMDQLASLWSQPAPVYLERTGLRPGWHWATLVHRSDMLVVAGIAMLATCSIASLAVAARAFAANRERVLALICVLQIVVLLVAAAGVL
jgi:hypothetical protein